MRWVNLKVLIYLGLICLMKKDISFGRFIRVMFPREFCVNYSKLHVE